MKIKQLQSSSSSQIERELSLESIPTSKDDERYILPNRPLDRPKSYNYQANKNNTIKNNTNKNNNNTNNNNSQETYSSLTNYEDNVYAVTNATLSTDDQYSALTSEKTFSALTSIDKYASLSSNGEGYSTPIHVEPPQPSDDYAVLEKNSQGADISNYFVLEEKKLQQQQQQQSNYATLDNQQQQENNYAGLENNYYVLEGANNKDSSPQKSDNTYSSLEGFAEQLYN